MEPLQEPISMRTARINAKILGKSSRENALNGDALLDALQTLYDECTVEVLQKEDRNIRNFVETFKSSLTELKMLRVNLTDFEIKSLIGRGHYGDVYVVKEKQTGDVYAMKSVRKSACGGDSKLVFREERDIMAFNTSEWLTSLQYAFQDTSHLFFIMDYHPGGDLLALLARQGGTIPETAAVFYLAELVVALNHLHQMGYVHRDVKPENILLDRCGHLKLADFGSAAKLDSRGFVTDGPPVGTPDYVAPEVLRAYETGGKNTSKFYGVLCDFWSLGIVAYELTIGTTPFAGPSTATVYSKIMTHSESLRFPPDVTLSHGYLSLIRQTLVDESKRLTHDKITAHPVFGQVDFQSLHGQVPPYIPKIASEDDASNFGRVASKKNEPSVENFKKRTRFSGRNLPFVGFTYTPCQDDFAFGFDKRRVFKEELVKKLREELDGVRDKMMKNDGLAEENRSLREKLDEKDVKLKNLESVREKLEKDFAGVISEMKALKRTLELERKDRVELEKRALDLIKGAKTKWESSEKAKTECYTLEIEQLKAKTTELTQTNKLLNEQLRRALQSKEQHKESLDKVDHLNRRSVMGLEQRLERVSNETQLHIADLQKKLSNEQHVRELAECELRNANEREVALKRKVETSEKNYDELRAKIDETETVIRELNKKIGALEGELEDVEGYREKNRKLEEELSRSERSVTELEMKLTLVEKEVENLKTIKGENDDLRESIGKLRNDDRINELKRKLELECEKSSKLEKQLKALEESRCESQELKELRMKFWRTEKELGNAKIDKRILERELKEARAEVKSSSEETERLKRETETCRRESERALLELNGINESLSMDLLKSKETVRSLERQLGLSKEKSQELKTVIGELRASLDAANKKEEARRGEIDRASDAAKELAVTIERNNALLKEKERVVNKLSLEKASLMNDCEKLRAEIRNKDLNLEALREACTVLETQLIEYEKLVASFRSKQASLDANVDGLVKDSCRAREEVREARKQTNEERSLRCRAEAELERARAETEDARGETAFYREQSDEYKRCAGELSQQLGAAEERIDELKAALTASERNAEGLERDVNALKEEVSNHLTTIFKLKEMNHRINKNLMDYKENNSMLLGRVEELQQSLNEKANHYKEREHKFNSTVKQHVKLIDYLQTRVDELSKKKSLTEILFGGHQKKENQPPTLHSSFRDLEASLRKEKQRNASLQEELKKAKSGTKSGVACKCTLKPSPGKSGSGASNKEVLEKIAQSSLSPKSELYRQNSVQRMRHNIPHRFETKICSRIQSCHNCDKVILLGRQVSVCKHCNVLAHPGCTGAMPRTCGLPDALIEHFSNTIIRFNDAGEKETDRDGGCAGFIKVADKNGAWVKQYAAIKGNFLNVYPEEPAKGKTVPPCYQLELRPKAGDSRGKIIFDPVMSQLEENVSENDLPFVLKIEMTPSNTCWPSKSFTFMTLSLSDKTMWFRALEKIFAEMGQEFETILELPEGLDLNVNCYLDLNERVKLLGTTKGLYTSNNGHLLSLNGPTEVHNVIVIQKINTVLMIVDEKNVLVSTDSNHLKSLSQCARFTKPQLSFKEVKIKGLHGFHLLDASDFNGYDYVIVATMKQLVLLNYSLETGEFIPIRILDTAEPTTCALFTDNSLIVGADKYFEIDLKTFQAEEFIDLTDARIKRIVSKCYEMKSYPLSVIQISDSPKEFLLSFNEFSIFLDEYGCSSRESELKSRHVPIRFFYHRPYLYIVQFRAVEIVKITPELCNREETGGKVPGVRVEIPGMKPVGFRKGVYVYVRNEIRLVSAPQLFGTDLSDLENESDGNASGGYSFSSSALQSLDGSVDKSP